MNNNFIKKYAGIILVLLGVACLVVYFFAPITNVLLAAGLVLEVLGIFAFIFLNRGNKK